MGFMQKMTEMAIGTSAYAHQERGLPFRAALEQSLLETRPGWTPAHLAQLAPLLDQAKDDRDMIRIAAAFALGRGM